MEEYKVINGFPNYEISTQGRVRRIKSGKYLKPFLLSANNYFAVDLCMNGKIQRMTIHRLVAINFLDNIEGKEQVNHINGVKTDNTLSNLEWNTRSENQLHSIKIGLRHTRGENNSQSKLTTKLVLRILNDNRKYLEIAADYGVSIPTISNIKTGYSWSHVTGLPNKL